MRLFYLLHLQSSTLCGSLARGWSCCPERFKNEVFLKKIVVPLDIFKYALREPLRYFCQQVRTEISCTAPSNSDLVYEDIYMSIYLYGTERTTGHWTLQERTTERGSLSWLESTHSSQLRRKKKKKPRVRYLHRIYIP